MARDALKRLVARAALDYIKDDTVVGVGTGSTVNCFIEYLADIKHRIEGAVASSVATEARLKQCGIAILPLNSVNDLPVYVDGADEANAHLYLVKGGGGALTREKIVAAVSRRFVCIIDDSKRVDIVGQAFPVPIEVIPMAQSYVAREMVKLGGRPVLRSGFTTDNGNIILDVHDLDCRHPPGLESEINQIAGVVSNGLFARRPADILLVAGDEGVEVIDRR